MAPVRGSVARSPKQRPVPPARHLLRAKDLADARYFEPLTVADLARAAGLSPAHFSREFRRTFGEPPHQYLLTRRLERAAALLRNTDRTVTEICFAVGLSSLGLVHHQLPAGLRHDAARPTAAAFPPARRHIRDPRLRGPGLRPPAEPHVSRSRAVLPSVASPVEPTTRRTPMIKIANAQFWVHDQDEALAFYTRTLGWEVRSDVTMDEWNFRWLVVGPVGQDDVGLVLMPVPGAADARRRAAAPSWPSWSPRAPAARCSSRPTTARPSYDELSARGVVFNDPPTPQPYGIDTSFRDPSGNNIRLTQVLEFSLDRGR